MNMSDQPPMAHPAQNVLGYATPGADGLPDVIPEAEVIIGQGKPPRAIRRFFRKADHAVRYFARSMTRRHSPEMLSDVCLGCGQTSRDYAIQLIWFATAPPRFLEFRLSSEEVKAPFPTIHPICQNCMHHWTARVEQFGTARRWVHWAQKSFWIVLIGWVVLQAVVPLSRFLPTRGRSNMG
ncbi:MAG: hypothetical protein H0T11_01175, partial [Chthoniobacterales bacterium]|nr:hypothetical protein [Chthoniobacterales bacterium]